MCVVSAASNSLLSSFMNDVSVACSCSLPVYQRDDRLSNVFVWWSFVFFVPTCQTRG